MKFELVVITLVLLQLAVAGDIKRDTNKKKHSLEKRTSSSSSRPSEFQRCIRNKNVLRHVENEVCEQCEDHVCLGNPCKNGGTCFSVADTQLCQCPPSYQGQFCEFECTVEFEQVVQKYDFDIFLIKEDTRPTSTEECNSTCTGKCDCTAFLFQDSTCTLFSAPVLSVTDGNLDVTCKRICEQQPTCLSYATDPSTYSNCYTFMTSTEGLPSQPSANLHVFFDKILKCKQTL